MEKLPVGAFPVEPMSLEPMPLAPMPLVEDVDPLESFLFDFSDFSVNEEKKAG